MTKTIDRLRMAYGSFRRVVDLWLHSPPDATLGTCPFCGLTVYFEPLPGLGIRCGQCSAGVVQISMGWALRELAPSLGSLSVCELSAEGAIASFVQNNAKSVALSEYYEGVLPGSSHGNVRCEDVQRLTYPADTFDLVTHTEVLEHVPDDRLAFRELLRVLRPGGRTIFTVPVHGGDKTLERARLENGHIQYLQEAVYHTDPLRAEGILAYRDYGRDILERLMDAGFINAHFYQPKRRMPYNDPWRVITAIKPS